MVSELQCSGQYFVVSVVSAKQTTKLVTFVISRSEPMSTPSFTGSFIQVSLTQAPLWPVAKQLLPSAEVGPHWLGRFP